MFRWSVLDFGSYVGVAASAMPEEAKNICVNEIQLACSQSFSFPPDPSRFPLFDTSEARHSTCSKFGLLWNYSTNLRAFATLFLYLVLPRRKSLQQQAYCRDPADQLLY